MTPIIGIMTDFGSKDGYVAAMKGVILGQCREVRFVDISHEIDPFRIESGAYVLHSVFDYFPPGSIFLCVVDPGVGTSRRGLAVEIDGKYLVGPDNGLFSWVLKSRNFRAFSLENRALFRSRVSSTFHGRDIFAPVAAFLANRGCIENVGPACDVFIAPWVDALIDGNEIQGAVIHIDRFGNVVTNIRREKVEKYFDPGQGVTVLIKDIAINGLVETYGDVPVGSVCALWGSLNHLEISVREGSARDFLKVSYGERVVCGLR